MKEDTLVLFLILGECFQFFSIENNVCHRLIIYGLYYVEVSLVLDGKASACNMGDLGLVSQSERSPGEGNGNPLQYSCSKWDEAVWLCCFIL